jgi:hypothetical protein
MIQMLASERLETLRTSTHPKELVAFLCCKCRWFTGFSGSQIYEGLGNGASYLER